MIRRPPRSTLFPYHDALPISVADARDVRRDRLKRSPDVHRRVRLWIEGLRSEEHTSELQSQSNVVCRLLLEKKTAAAGLAAGLALLLDITDLDDGGLAAIMNP